MDSFHKVSSSELDYSSQKKQANGVIGDENRQKEIQPTESLEAQQ